FEETRDRHYHKVVLALAEGGRFFGKHANDRVSVSAYSDDFADRRFVREQAFLNYFSDDDHTARKIDIFVIQIATIAERISICCEKTAVSSHDEEAWRRFHAIINSLTFQLVAKALEANLARIALHYLIIMQRLAIADVFPVLIFFLNLAPDIHVRRLFC